MTDQTRIASPARCPRCGADNRCALARGAAIAQCWCRTAPVALPVPDAAPGCYCAACLQASGAAARQDGRDAR